MLAHGSLPYQSIDAPPWIFGNYPPLYIALVAPLLTDGAPSFAPGRLGSVIATLLAATLLALLVRRIGGRTGPALLCAGLWLAAPIVRHWGSLHRVDMLGLALAIAGILVVAIGPRHRAAWWSAPVFVLALLAKQTLVVAPIATYVWLFTIDRRRAVQSAALLVGLGATGMAALQLSTAGQFFLHIVSYNANEWTMARAAWATGRLLARDQFWPLALIGAIGAIACLRSFRRWGAIGLWLVLAAMMSLTVGKVGANVNYFLETTAATCAVTGLLLTRTDRRSARVVMALVATQAILWLGVDIRAAPALAAGHPKVEAERHAVERVREAVGPVLSQNCGLIVLAGKELVYQPFAGALLIDDGRLASDDVVDWIESGRFALVVVDFDLEVGPRTRFDRTSVPAWLRSAVLRSYRSDGAIGQHRFWVPRPELTRAEARTP